MKSLIAAVILLPLALIGCSAVPTSTGDVNGCAAALIASNSTDPVQLFDVAKKTPACLALAGDALNLAIDLAVNHNITLRRVHQ